MRILAAVVVVAAFASAAEASFTINSDSITDFEFEGMLFDLTFGETTYDAAFPSVDPYFLGQNDKGEAFLTALSEALTDVGVGPVNGTGILFLPTSDDGTYNSGPIATYDAATPGWGLSPTSYTFSNDLDLSQSDVEEGQYLIVTKTGNVVPEPSTIAVWSLLGLLGGAATLWQKRRKKHAL